MPTPMRILAAPHWMRAIEYATKLLQPPARKGKNTPQISEEELDADALAEAGSVAAVALGDHKAAASVAISNKLRRSSADITASNEMSAATGQLVAGLKADLNAAASAGFLPPARRRQSIVAAIAAIDPTINADAAVAIEPQV